MSLTKQNFEETWYEYSSRISLHWMEEEYFNYIAPLNKNKKSHDKLEKQEEKSHLESERPYIRSSQEIDNDDKGLPRS